MSQDEFELTFLSADQFDLKSMEGQTTRYRRARPYTPSPVDPDTFQRGLQTVRFLRDAAGKVVALELTNPALRRIRFTTRRP